MKDLVKLVAFAVLVIALAPFAGFWIVALVGAGLLALPLAAVISKFCPNIWRHLEDVLASKTHFVTPVSYTHLDVYKRQAFAQRKFVHEIGT